MQAVSDEQLIEWVARRLLVRRRLNQECVVARILIHFPSMTSLWKELKRRNVVRVGLAYILVAWVILQIADFALQVIDAPGWVLQVLVLLAAIGLPAFLVFAWVFEMTPEGLKLESEVDRSQSIVHNTGQKLNYVIIGVLALAVVFLGARQFVLEPTTALKDPVASTVQTDNQSDTDLNQPTSIAVLPFEDYSENSDQDYFSKGIAEEVLNLLAKTNALRVAARTSSFAFSGGEMDIRQIGEKLGVNTVLEGSIRKAGPTIRITAQLINVEDGYHIWSETYDREYTDIFKIQDEIAASIMDSLKVHLMGETVVKSERAADVEAYSAYLIGKERMALRTQKDIEAALDQFEKALAIDPTFAPAHVYLAHAWLLLEQDRFGGKDIEPEDVDEIIVPHLDKALELAPDLPEAIAVKGYHDLRRWRFDAAEKAFDQAIKLNPSYAMAYGWRAETHYEQDRFLDMLADKEKAYALDPMSLQISSELAAEYRNFWRPKDAERVINRMFDLHPDHPLAYRAAVGNLLNHGRYGEGLLMLERAIAANPDNQQFKERIGWLHYSLGLYEEVQSSGDDQARFMMSISSGDFDTAQQLLDDNLNSEDADDWYGFGRWYHELTDGENSKVEFRKLLELSLENMNKMGIPWQEQCFVYLIHDLRYAGRTGDTESMMAKCKSSVEERFKAQYLCPCSWYNVVLYTILDGRMDEAIERADQWLSHGDSSTYLHIDPVFSQLSDRPEYSDFLARNAAQIERQRNIYLQGRKIHSEDDLNTLN